MAQTTSYKREHYRLPLPTAYPVMFAGAAAIGEGTVTNLSVLGCTIECDAMPPSVTNLLLRVILPDRQESLPIEEAEVRWMEDRRIGVQFRKVERAANLRLHGFVWDRMLERLQAISQNR
ncbi:MAG: PilZ domain-containing protein [Nitrospira sp.]|nr:MAG: PilZ domain-containing protein [Nitrospira sp.]